MPENAISRAPMLKEPEDEHTFDTIYGVFTLRRPTLRMQRDIHLAAARGLQGLPNVDALGESLNFMMATVEVCARGGRQALNEKPLGWPRGFDWDHCHDYDWLTDLFSKHADWVSSFRESREARRDQDMGTSGGADAGVPTPDAEGVGAT